MRQWIVVAVIAAGCGTDAPPTERTSKPAPTCQSDAEALCSKACTCNSECAWCVTENGDTWCRTMGAIADCIAMVEAQYGCNAESTTLAVASCASQLVAAQCTTLTDGFTGVDVSNECDPDRVEENNAR